LIGFAAAIVEPLTSLCFFVGPPRPTSYLLLLVQKKVTEEKDTFAVAVVWAPVPKQLRERAAGFADSTSVY
jgi:hypothetical protein